VVRTGRVRRLGEFLDEAEATGGAMPPAAYTQGKTRVRTPGLGFRYRFDGEPDATGAPSLGQDTQTLLAELGLGADAIQALCEARAIA
jgi:crotonobetainyl-CoA:carnitine CoA-transferase CaiB-like acyl-CoA transferase